MIMDRDSGLCLYNTKKQHYPRTIFLYNYFLKDQPDLQCRCEVVSSLECALITNIQQPVPNERHWSYFCCSLSQRERKTNCDVKAIDGVANIELISDTKGSKRKGQLCGHCRAGDKLTMLVAWSLLINCSDDSW